MIAQIPTFLKTLNIKDPFPKQFEQKVKEDGKRLSVLLQEGKNERYHLQGQFPDPSIILTASREESKHIFEATFMELLVEALTPPGFAPPDAATGTIHTNVFAMAQPLYGKSSFLLRKSAELLKEYDSLNQQASALQRPQEMGKKWEEENEKALHIIRAGRMAIGAEVEKLLGDNTSQANKKGGLLDPEDSVELLLHMGRDKTHEEQEDTYEGWANVARGVEKGFNQIYKVIAEEV